MQRLLARPASQVREAASALCFQPWLWRGRGCERGGTVATETETESVGPRNCCFSAGRIGALWPGGIVRRLLVKTPDGHQSLSII
jgi:hypothetical protein